MPTRRSRRTAPSRSTGRVEVGSQRRSSSPRHCRARAGVRSGRGMPPSGVHPSRCGYRVRRAGQWGAAGRRGSRGCGLRSTPGAVRPATMPELVPPMLAAPGPLPDGGDWVVEFAWEGLRCLAHVRPDRARLRTVNGRDVTSSFPELVEPLTRRAPRGGMVLDGTVVAVGEGGLPRRRLLQRRTAAARPSAAVLRRTPVALIVGDLLWVAGRDLADPALPPAPGAARGARHLRTAGRGLPDVPGRGGRGRHAHRRGVRRRGAARPPPRRPVQGRAGGRGPGCGSRCAGRGRWSSGAGRRRTRTGRTGSARCCSVCPTPSRTGGCATWAGPGSGRGRSSGRSRHSWPGCAAPPRRSARRCPPGSAATRSGPSPAWSGGSSSPTGRPTGGCACPRGAGSSRAARTPGGRCSARPTLPADPVAGAPVVPRQESRTAPPEPAQDIGPAARARDRGPAPRAALRLQRPEHDRRPDAHRLRPGP